MGGARCTGHQPGRYKYYNTLTQTLGLQRRQETTWLGGMELGYSGVCGTATLCVQKDGTIFASFVDIFASRGGTGSGLCVVSSLYLATAAFLQG